MKTISRTILALCCGIAGAGPAAATTDFMTVAKVACTSDSFTVCQEDKCTTRPADEREVLLIDFPAKKAWSRRGGEMKILGALSEVKVTGGARRFDMVEAVSGRSLKMSMTLSKDGKLLTIIGGSPSGKVQAHCVAEP